MEILFLFTNVVSRVNVASKQEEVNMQERVGFFVATAANGMIFASDLLEAGGGFLAMLLGVLP